MMEMEHKPTHEGDKTVRQRSEERRALPREAGLRRLKGAGPLKEPHSVKPLEMAPSVTPVEPAKRDEVHAIARQKALEVLYSSLEVCEASSRDIPAIMSIYGKLYYKREAFQLLADKELCLQLDDSDDEEERHRVNKAMKEVSSGGEFSDISYEEWIERINDEGERVLLLKRGDKIIGVNSYAIGAESQKQIVKRFSAINLNHTGEEWRRGLSQDHEILPMSYPHLLMIHDTFFDPDHQGNGLFQIFYEKTVDFEISLSSSLMSEENKSKWGIYYFVNRFESIFREDQGDTQTLDLADSIQVNNDTIRAGMRFGAVPIGITSSHELYGNEAIAVPSLGKTEGLHLLSADNMSRVMVKRGYLDMLVPVKTLLRQREMREVEAKIRDN
jgi:hypothetical protein